MSFIPIKQATVKKCYPLAEFVFDVDPIGDQDGESLTFQAISGFFYETSVLFDVNTNSTDYKYNDEERSIRNHGFYYNKSDPDKSGCWLLKTSTKGFTDITLSSQQCSSEPNGPRDFQVEISTNKKSWTAIQGGYLKMGAGEYKNSAALIDLKLPSMADNQTLLYIRWQVSSDTRVDGDTGIEECSCRIRNIYLKGNTDQKLTIAPAGVTRLPRAGAEYMAVDTPVSVSFNIDITVNEALNVSIVSKDKALTGVTAAVDTKDNRILKISHPNFEEGKSYTVTIPKNLVAGFCGMALKKDITWSFKTIDPASTVPSLLNMTFGGDPKTSMSFDWYTSKIISGTKLKVIEYSKLRNREFPNAAGKTFNGSSQIISTYMVEADRSVNNRANFASHKVTAKGLKPGTKYAYLAGSGNKNEWGSIGSFTTDSEKNQDFHFMVIADPQAADEEGFDELRDTLERGAEKIGDPKFIVVTGDFSDSGECEQYWQWCLKKSSSVLSKVPIVPLAGNHESNEDCGANNNFFYHFNTPKDPGIDFPKDTSDGTVYSFEYGNALFMVINTQYIGRIDEKGNVENVDEQFTKQINWMKNQIAKTDKRWKFVLLHKSPYSAATNAHYESDRVRYFRKFLVPIIDELGVDMVFQGHDHMYMRSYQMFNNKVQKVIKDEQGNVINPKGIVYLMTGTGAVKFYQKYKDYDDYFAAIDTQPNKKLFTDVSVTDGKLSFKSYTAAMGVELKEFDSYSIKRDDTKPQKAVNAKAEAVNGSIVITWDAPESNGNITEYRIYEKDDKIANNWSLSIPAVKNKATYSYTLRENVENISSSYNFIIKTASERLNSDPVSVTYSAVSKKQV